MSNSDVPILVPFEKAYKEVEGPFGRKDWVPDDSPGEETRRKAREEQERLRQKAAEKAQAKEQKKAEKEQMKAEKDREWAQAHQDETVDKYQKKWKKDVRADPLLGPGSEYQKRKDYTAKKYEYNPLDYKLSELNDRENSKWRKLGRGGLFALKYAGVMAQAAAEGGEKTRKLLQTLLNPSATGLKEANAAIDMTVDFLNVAGNSMINAAKLTGDEHVKNTINAEVNAMTRKYLEMLMEMGVDDISQMNVEQLDEFTNRYADWMEQNRRDNLSKYQGTALEKPLLDAINSVSGTIERRGAALRSQARTERLGLTARKKTMEAEAQAAESARRRRIGLDSARALGGIKSYFDEEGLDDATREARQLELKDYERMIGEIIPMGDHFSDADGGASYMLAAHLIDGSGNKVMDGGRFQPIAVDENGVKRLNVFLDKETYDAVMKKLEQEASHGATPEISQNAEETMKALTRFSNEAVYGAIKRKKAENQAYADMVYREVVKNGKEESPLVKTSQAIEKWNKINHSSELDDEDIATAGKISCGRGVIYSLVEMGLNKDQIERYIANGGIASLDKDDLDITDKLITKTAVDLMSNKKMMDASRSLDKKIEAATTDAEKEGEEYEDRVLENITEDERRVIERRAMLRQMIWTHNIGTSLHKAMDPSQDMTTRKVETMEAITEIERLVGGSGVQLIERRGTKPEDLIAAIMDGDMEDLYVDLQGVMVLQAHELNAMVPDRNTGTYSMKLSSAKSLVSPSREELDNYSRFVADSTHAAKLANIGMIPQNRFGHNTQNNLHPDQAAAVAYLKDIRDAFGPRGLISDVLDLYENSSGPFHAFYGKFGSGGHLGKDGLPYMHPDSKTHETFMKMMNDMRADVKDQLDHPTDGPDRTAVSNVQKAKILANMMMSSTASYIGYALASGDEKEIADMMANLGITDTTADPKEHQMGNGEMDRGDLMRLFVQVVRNQSLMDTNKLDTRNLHMGSVLMAVLSNDVENGEKETNAETIGQIVRGIVQSIDQIYSEGGY